MKEGIINMKILVIAAHPDDEILGVGGTINKYIRRGEQVYVYIVTEGCSTQDRVNSKVLERKRKEALKANEILGVEEIIFGNLPDMKLDTLPHFELNNEILKIVDRVSPDIVFTHHYSDLNNDHRKVYEATMVACRPLNNKIKEIYLYEVLSSTEWSGNEKNFVPNTFISLEEYDLEMKIKAIQEYKTELREYPHPRSEKGIENLAKYRGQIISAKYAETFELIRKIEN